MRTPSFSLELTALLVLILIPWPGPTVFKISCPRDNARIVRKLVQKKWMPILEKRSVKLGLECPFHPSRDLFGAQQAAKQQHRASQWACAFCGKSFYTERHLDQHFDSRHRDSIHMGEDAVCLADYCDVMRCEVLAAKEAHRPGPEGSGTDIEVWRSGTNMAARTALSVSAPRDLARVASHAAFPSLKAPAQPSQQHSQQQHARKQARRCPPAQERGAGGSGKDKEGDANATADRAECGGTGTKDSLVDSSVPPPQPPQQQRLSEMQRFKADCKPEELNRLKTRCETLVRDCIAGLLVNLSVQDFKEIEEELNRASCWYLTCDRYWEDSPAEARSSPWVLLALMVAMLTVGVIVCYYIIWVLFEPPPTPPTATPVVHHHHHQLHQSMPHPMAAGPGRHYPMHSASGSPSPHLSHASQMSHMQHLAQMPRASSAGPMGHLGHNIGHLSGAGGAPSSLPKQDPNPFEREWRI